MTAAYVLAGELYKAKENPETGLQQYEHCLRSFIMGKQEATERFAHSFAPQTRLGLFLRNQITKVSAMPFVAKLALGMSVIDRMDLPNYAGSSQTFAAFRAR
jgi:2-polyprenyl-6-methoxyphenol hydroxylase-like FAD-dependent oxidoreductase